jgi:hypothetical protein
MQEIYSLEVKNTKQFTKTQVMVYALLIFSALLALVLNVWQRYMEYFPESKTKLYKPSPVFIRKTLLKNFFRKQPADQNDPRSKIPIALVAGFKNFFFSFCLVSLVFAALQIWLTITAYSNLSQQTVLGIEARLHFLKEKVAPFEKYKFLPEFLLIALLIGLASSWSFIERLKLRERYKTLMKGFGFVTGLLTIAVCFTFFGNEFEKGEKGIEGQLKIHELRLLENNKLLVKEVQGLAEKNVAEAFADAPQVKEVLEDRESGNKMVDSLLLTADCTFYTEFTVTAIRALDHAASKTDADDGGDAKSAISRLKLDQDVSTAADKYEQDFTTSYATWREKQPWARQTDYQSVNTDAPYYQDLRESQYDGYLRSAIVQETGVSEATLTDEKAVLEEVRSEWPSASSRWYDKYGELWEKTIDKTYGLTVKGWVNQTAESIFSGVPLIGELLDPVHDLLKDLIYEKFKKLMAAIGNKDKAAVINELNATSRQVNAALAEKSIDRSAWDRLRGQAVSVRQKVVELGRRMKTANIKTRKLVASHLEEMKAGNRWQAIRERFAQKARYAISSNDPSSDFSLEQWQEFKQMLQDWDDYMSSHQEVWWRDGVKDLEKEFYHYISTNPVACGAWGFILQQEDWDGAVYFYNFTAPDASATGKPYYLLKYYCATTNYGQIENLYTKEVNDKGVGPLCPHH